MLERVGAEVLAERERIATRVRDELVAACRSWRQG